jgi:hypothetical protein
VAQIAQNPWLIDFVNGIDQPLDTCRQLAKDGGADFDGDAVNTALSEPTCLPSARPITS